MSAETEPTLIPTLPDKEGKFYAQPKTAPKSGRQGQRAIVPPPDVIPVILVPGIMGTNLKAKVGHPSLAPGASVWTPPNGSLESLAAVNEWKKLTPEDRQRRLTPEFAEVDDDGKIDGSFDRAIYRRRGWGEVHYASYNVFLETMEKSLNAIVSRSWLSGKPTLTSEWRQLVAYSQNPEDWTVDNLPALSEDQVRTCANARYPVYAVGYNWLQSNGQSGERLSARIRDIIKEWSGVDGHRCSRVIVVTHSMGGLVARAAVQNPETAKSVLGVLHCVLPALGAAATYRRIAGGTPGYDPKAPFWDADSGFATIVGPTTAHTTPIMATAPGPLELMPNHLYPAGWLRIKTDGLAAPIQLPDGNPYDLYRDFTSWYAPINLQLANPANQKFVKSGGIGGAVVNTINTTEEFHRNVVGSRYHANTYVHYGKDAQKLAFGNFTWFGTGPYAGVAISAEQVKAGKLVDTSYNGIKTVSTPHSGVLLATLSFLPSTPDSPGDDTVPNESGRGPKGQPGVRKVFETHGHDHQGSFAKASNQDLVRYVVATMVSEVL